MWWALKLECGDYVAEVRDTPLHIGSPGDEVVDLGGGSLDRCDRGGVGRQGGVQPVEEGLDGGIHGGQVRSRLSQAPSLDELSQIDAEGGWGLASDTRCKSTDRIH